jgi:hypothetical protein
MALSTMGAVADAWCATSGFTFDRASACAPRHPRERSGKRIRHSYDEPGREGGSEGFAARIVPFAGVQAVPPRDQYAEGDE